MLQEYSKSILKMLLIKNVMFLIPYVKGVVSLGIGQIEPCSL